MADGYLCAAEVGLALGGRAKPTITGADAWLAKLVDYAHFPNPPGSGQPRRVSDTCPQCPKNQL